MVDEQIVQMYWDRNEDAIVVTGHKYGTYCYRIARNILELHEDSEECVSDTWLRAWNTMPPQRPSRLQQFLAKITRHLAFDRFKRNTAQKRGSGQMELVLSELESCIPGPGTPEEDFIAKELADSVNRFVQNLPERDANIFVRRYFFTEALSDISARYGMTENNVAVILNRVRNRLKNHLEKEGYHL